MRAKAEAVDREAAEIEARGQREHAAKYDALIDQMGGLEYVCHRLPREATPERIRALIAADDDALNGIPLKLWDNAAGFAFSGSDLLYFRREGWPPNLSPAERVCILKRAAVRMAAEKLTAALNALFEEAATGDDGFRQWYYPGLPYRYSINPQALKLAGLLTDAGRTPAEVLNFARAVAEGRATCPTANGKDLETWEQVKA